MIIECLTKRVGITMVEIGKVKYLFQPPQGAKKGEFTTSIAEVTAEEHVNYLLNHTRGNFREYDPERTLNEMTEARKQMNIFLGFSIPKYKHGGTEGYVVMDFRKPNKPRYAGMDGNWVEKWEGMTPFLHEIEAWEWLKEEAPLLAMEERESPPKPPDIPVQRVLKEPK